MKCLNEVKGKLGVTWTEDDERIEELIKAAKADIDYTCGGSVYRFDYIKPGPAKTLMLEHVFYNWNNALSEFKVNYAPELTQLSIMAALAQQGRESDA